MKRPHIPWSHVRQAGNHLLAAGTQRSTRCVLAWTSRWRTRLIATMQSTARVSTRTYVSGPVLTMHASKVVVCTDSRSESSATVRPRLRTVLRKAVCAETYTVGRVQWESRDHSFTKSAWETIKQYPFTTAFTVASIATTAACNFNVFGLQPVSCRLRPLRLPITSGRSWRTLSRSHGVIERLAQPALVSNFFYLGNDGAEIIPSMLTSCSIFSQFEMCQPEGVSEDDPALLIWVATCAGALLDVCALGLPLISNSRHLRLPSTLLRGLSQSVFGFWCFSLDDTPVQFYGVNWQAKYVPILSIAMSSVLHRGQGLRCDFLAAAIGLFLAWWRAQGDGVTFPFKPPTILCSLITWIRGRFFTRWEQSRGVWTVARRLSVGSPATRVRRRSQQNASETSVQEAAVAFTPQSTTATTPSTTGGGFSLRGRGNRDTRPSRPGVDTSDSGFSLPGGVDTPTRHDWGPGNRLGTE
eukprot:GFYU01004163.1.p1 GENE.GFYU01004163.1~~GFYU01004163.1.p1  ORF type:complete len:469 (-),score=46.73 GFYU01004163.1:170-1576(-)